MEDSTRPRTAFAAAIDTPDDPGERGGMFRTRASASTVTRTLLVAAVAATPLLLTTPAFAMANVTTASFSNGTLTVTGNAIWDRPITVDGVVMGTSDGGGLFTITQPGYTPPADCTVDVNDGSAKATTVTLKGCTPTVATVAMLPDRAELGPFTVGVNPGSTVVSFPGSIGPDSWQIVAGALPKGLTMTVPQPTARPLPNTPQQLTYAQIVGTPTTPGTGSITFKATDSRGLTATRTYTVTVNPGAPLTMAPEAWASPLRVGESDSQWVDAGGGVQPYSWSVVGGAVPTGMTFVNDIPGGTPVRVTGTPTTAGDFTWTLRMTDALGTTLTQNFTATVAAPLAPAPEPAPAPAPQPAPVSMSIQSFSLNPATVAGGAASTGTVTVSTTAPAGGTAVILSSSNPQLAAVPATVTVPAGATSATFPITTTAVAFDQSATIDATYAGTLQSKLTVTAPVPPNADTVSIGRAEYDTAKNQLRVDASSSGSGAVLKVYYTGTDTLIGTISGTSGQFTVGLNPVNITVRSSLGGTASKAVTAK
jgi:Putative Ig domain